MVQHGKTMMQHNEIVKIMGQITNGLGVVGVVPNGSFAKVVVFFHREGDEKKEFVTMVTPNGIVFGNLMP
jgi:hypothetical protein